MAVRARPEADVDVGAQQALDVREPDALGEGALLEREAFLAARREMRLVRADVGRLRHAASLPRCGRACSRTTTVAWPRLHKNVPRERSSSSVPCTHAPSQPCPDSAAQSSHTAVKTVTRGPMTT